MLTSTSPEKTKADRKQYEEPNWVECNPNSPKPKSGHRRKTWTSSQKEQMNELNWIELNEWAATFWEGNPTWSHMTLALIYILHIYGEMFKIRPKFLLLPISLGFLPFFPPALATEVAKNLSPLACTPSHQASLDRQKDWSQQGKRPQVKGKDKGLERSPNQKRGFGGIRGERTRIRKGPDCTVRVQK